MVTMMDRALAGAAAAHLTYRLWSGWGEGVIYGDGDEDVRADEHPSAFVLTALTVVFLIVLLGYIAIGSSAADLASFARWLRKL